MRPSDPLGETVRKFLILAVFLLQAFPNACRTPPPPQPKARVIGWRHIGDWSGRGSTQTESFNIEGTQWRITWEAKGDTTPSTGSLVIMVHSAVSGRPIALGVEHKGNGKGVAYVTEDPRLYHLVVDSSGLDWSFSVDEAVPGEAASGS